MYIIELFADSAACIPVGPHYGANNRLCPLPLSQVIEPPFSGHEFCSLSDDLPTSCKSLFLFQQAFNLGRGIEQLYFCLWIQLLLRARD